MDLSQLISALGGQTAGPAAAAAGAEPAGQASGEGFLRLLAARTAGQGAGAGAAGEALVTPRGRQDAAVDGNALPDGPLRELLDGGDPEGALAQILAQLGIGAEGHRAPNPGAPAAGTARGGGQRPLDGAALAQIKQLIAAGRWPGGSPSSASLLDGAQGGAPGRLAADGAEAAGGREIAALLGEGALKTAEGHPADGRLARLTVELAAARGNETGAHAGSSTASPSHSAAATQAHAGLAAHATAAPNHGSAATPQPTPSQPLPQGFHAIETSPQQPGWNQAVGERVVWMASRDMQAAEFRLHPPQLGSLDVRVSVNNDQAQVSFTVQHGAVRDAVESALPRLREMFEQEGFALVDVDVSERQAGSQAESDAQGTGGGDGLGAEAEEPEDGAPPVAYTTGRGLIDAYV